jgi:uncharacterized membrane protein
MNRKYVLPAILVVALAGGVGYFYGGSHAPAGQLPFLRLTPQNVDEVKNAFNAVQDDVRVIVLFSPT